MSSTNHTQHYGLSQWEPEDAFLRTDFNEDHKKIDEALFRKCEVQLGTFTGDGAASRFIDLGFTPQAVYLSNYEGSTRNGYAHYGGLAMKDAPVTMDQNNPVLTIVEGGFMVYVSHPNTGGYVSSNGTTSRLRYIAFR